MTALSSPGSPERDQPARARRKDDSTPDGESAAEQTTSEDAHVLSSARSREILENDSAGARLWVLPTTSGMPWAIIEERDALGLGESFGSDPPIIFVSATAREKDHRITDCARAKVHAQLLDRFHEALFNFGTRFIIGIAWMLVALGSARISGEARIFGEILLACGLGFAAYTVLRYGFGVIRWHNRRVDAIQAFSGAALKIHPLATRLAAALELRGKLKSDERGRSPDDELLDSNAYRKLIDEGITSIKELTALGRAVENQLGPVAPDGTVRKIGDVARDAGINTETAIFYRDLAAAASEIELQERARIDG